MKTTPNHLPDTDAHDAHTGRAGGNTIDQAKGMELAQVGLAGLLDGTTHCAELHRTHVMHPTLGVMCMMLSVKVENANDNSPHMKPESYLPILSSLMADWKSGKLECLGATDLVVSLPNAPRADVYTIYYRAT